MNAYCAMINARYLKNMRLEWLEAGPALSVSASWRDDLAGYTPVLYDERHVDLNAKITAVSFRPAPVALS
jgi:hypothetical protein